MIAVGIGCRRDVGGDEIAAVVRMTLAEAGLTPAEIDCLAVPRFKQDEAGIHAAATMLALKIRLIEPPDLEHAAGRATTHSLFVMAQVGVSSVAEAAALAAAGPASRLHGPRRATGAVTCAIAIDEAT